jgi:bifunctional non-homologous end joining protein LigD
MLARTAELPRGSGYAFEVKWDGFRALVSTVERLVVRSRRGWDMTHAVSKLARLPEGLILDGELIALSDDGLPSFPRLAERVLHGHDGVAISYVIFDVLACDGHSVMENTYADRRALLEELELEGRGFCTAETFEDGHALFSAVIDQGLEGIVAKPLTSPYRPGQPGWLKIRNRAYWRFGEELARSRSHGSKTISPCRSRSRSGNGGGRHTAP